MTDALVQMGIIFTGIVAVSLSQSTEHRVRRWSSVFGLLGQPFWIYVTVSNALWGMALVSIAYTLAWGRGFYLNWLSVQETT